MSRKPIRSRRTSAATRPQGPRALWLAGLGAVALTRRDPTTVTASRVDEACAVLAWARACERGLSANTQAPPSTPKRSF